jgi:two-component system, OmpR family, KDP operon response regulator KdpE
MEKAAKTVLVIDDERDVTHAIALTITLQEPTWQVVTALSGDEGLARLESLDPDAILLDLQLPGLHGFDVLRQIRLFSDVPVIILSVRDDELDKVRGLQLGADDYLVKPFGRLELVARLRTVLRRAAGLAGPSEPPACLGDLYIDWDQRRVAVCGTPVRLTGTEFRLLEVLARSAGRIVPTEVLLARIWGADATDDGEYVKTYVHRLRAKLEVDPARPRYLLTERGVGYWMPRCPRASGAR